MEFYNAAAVVSSSNSSSSGLAPEDPEIFIRVV